jgi:aconitate hydratase
MHRYGVDHGDIARINTSIEVEYYRHGGILPFMLRQLLGKVS